MSNKVKKQGMSIVCLKAVVGTLVILLVGSNIFSVVGASEGERVNCKTFEFNHIQTPKANDIVNYTQMALDFIQENYPNKTYYVFNNSTWIPYPETGYHYEQVEIDIMPGNSSPKDTVIVTIRHDTLNIEFGNEQYQRDFDEYYNSLPLYYKKMGMGSMYRVMIRERIGYLPNITDPASESYRTNFTIYYTPENQTKVVSFLRETNQNYSIVKVASNNDSFIISNMTLKNCLVTANQSYVQNVGIYVLINFELYVIDSWPDDTNIMSRTDFLFGIVIVLVVISAFTLYYFKKYIRLKSEKNK